MEILSQRRERQKQRDAAAGTEFQSRQAEDAEPRVRAVAAAAVRETTAPRELIQTPQRPEQHRAATERVAAQALAAAVPAPALQVRQRPVQVSRDGARLQLTLIQLRQSAQAPEQA